jgi:hypothetical protein
LGYVKDDDLPSLPPRQGVYLSGNTKDLTPLEAAASGTPTPLYNHFAVSYSLNLTHMLTRAANYNFNQTHRSVKRTKVHFFSWQLFAQEFVRIIKYAKDKK